MSFLSPEPQSRVFLESHSNSLLAQFDIQSKVIADRYLTFFQERRRIEAFYVDSLRKLHLKATTTDASFDARAEPSTTRVAWDKVRDNLEREANTQQAFVDILDNDVIKPLATLKETGDQTRKRVEKDLEESAAKYADHTENTVLKFQQAYFKKHHPRQSNDASERPEDVPNQWIGGRVLALFSGQREEPTKSEEVSDDDCRRAVGRLNNLRLMRAESLGGGYDCLEELVFTPIVKDVLVKYMNGMITVRTKYDDLAISTRGEVERALAGTDTSDLRASFGHALSISIPPFALYCNYRPDAYSDLIFGVPLVDLAANHWQDNVPKVMRMCIEEVEKRGLDTHKIYSVDSLYDAKILQLRRRLESEKTFSFSSTDDIYTVAMLLELYLWDLPEPLFMLPLQDYGQYRLNRARYTENDCSVLRSKIRELHPVHSASLEFLLRHLLRVTTHSDKNAMTVEALAARFCYTVLRGNSIYEGGVHPKRLVMEDLIRHAYILFDDPPSTPTYGSSLSPAFSRSAEAQAMGSTIRHRPGLVGGVPTSTQSSFSITHPDSPSKGPLTPTLGPLLSPLLGLRSSQTLRAGVETTTQEQVIPEAGGTRAFETLPNTSPPEVLSPPYTSVAELQLPHMRLHPHQEALTRPQSPTDSLLSSSTDFLLSPAMSLQSATGTFSSTASERF